MSAFLSLVVPILLALEAIAYIIAVVRMLQRRAGQESVATLTTLYALASVLLLAVDTLQALNVLSFSETAIGNIHSFSALLLAFLMVLMVRAFLRLHSEIWIGVAIFWTALLTVLASGILPLPDVLWSNGQYMLPTTQLIFALVLVGWILFLAGSILTTVHWHRRTRQPLHRNRISYWLPVFVLVILNDAIIFSTGKSWGSLFRLMALLIVAYVLTRVHLPDIRQILRKVFSYLAAIGLIIGGYFAGISLLERLQALNFNLPVQATGLGVTLVIAALGMVLFSLFRRVIFGLLPIESYNPSVTLRDYSLSISNILDMERLATVAVGLIIEAMDIRRGFLFLVDKEPAEAGQLTYRLRGVRGAGDRSVRGGTLSGGAPIARYLSLEHKPLLQYDLDMVPGFRESPPGEREWFSSLDTEVYVPIYAKNEWIGLLAVGAKSSGNRYTDDDLNVLATLANQTAVALENARLVDNLIRLNREIRQAYQALDQANRNLERLDQTKTNFISIASHELRTPLTVLRGYTEMLLDDPVIQQNAYHLQTIQGIHKGTLRLHEIMDSMFDIAQLDARTADLTLQSVDVPELIHSVCNGLMKSVQERKQTLNVDLPSLPAIKADPNTLRKVFYHLLTNAVKFTPNGGKIGVVGRILGPNQRDLPEGGVEIVVVDTGVGVDPNYRELIFTKFYQGDEDLNRHSTGKTKFKGSGAGLGLALSRGIVEAHGGRIWVESPGYDEINFPGSHFHVILPLRHQSDSATVRMGDAVKLKV